MNKIAFFVALSFVAASAIPQKAVVADSTVHSRDYRFSFANGNLLANWSFEDGFYAWEGSRHSKDEVAVLTGRNISPVSGSYVGVASGSHPIISAEVPVESGTDYSLSLYVANFGGGTEKPKISFYSSRDVFLSDSILPDFPASYEKWNFYSASIKVPATARFAKVVFENTGNGILLFDDVILEKGLNPSDRSSVGMSIDFLDAFGRTHMKETLVHREKSDELIPKDPLFGTVVYGKDRVEIGARSRAYGGNIESGDYMSIDNDVKVRDESVQGFHVAAKNTIQLGDRDSLYADVFYGKKLNKGHQDYIRHSEKSDVIGVYNFDFGSFEIGTEDVTIKKNKELTLAPGKYRNLVVQKRGTLHLSSGAYYFRKFTLNPSATLDLDVSGGNIEIYVDSDFLVYDNTQFTHDSTSTNFILWRLGLSSTTRLGTSSTFAGIFIAPNARVELGHGSYLRGAIYAREVFLMQDSKIKAPSFVFERNKNVYAISENRYDAFGRKFRSDMPYLVELDSEGYVLVSEMNANIYYSALGDGPDAGGFAYYEKEYSPKDGQLLKNSIPGDLWSVDGAHSGMSYHQAFVPDLSIPASLNFSYHAGDSVYVLSASKDREGRVSLSWKNRLGQLVQEAWVLDTVGIDMRGWNWAIKRYEYTREGRLRRVLTPLDTKNADSLFAIVSEYDASGREIARTAPDIGRETFYYGVAGNKRFSQTAEQRLRDAFTYRDYDEQGRVVSIGESVWPSVSDNQLGSIAAAGSAIPGTKTEYSGKAYDKLSKCIAAIGDTSLSTALSGVTLLNTRGRLACTWARNPMLYGFITPSEALVADFFSYDSVGRVSVAYRYTGAERDVSRRLISKRASYDDQARLKKVEIRDADGVPISERNFDYDVKGRVSAVKDASGNLLAAYSYDDFGRKEAVNVGGAFRAEYGYHLHGQVNSIRIVNPTTSAVLYEQHVNYEKINGNKGQPRFDGRVSQVVSTTKLPDSTLSDNFVYIYDMVGNLETKTGTAGETTFAYDENGRMLSQGDASARLDYVYGPGSYAVSRATRRTPMDGDRDASRTGNFRYDASGRMVYDSSRGLSVTYGMNGMPAVFLQDSGNGIWRELVAYDPAGWRVATYSFENGNIVSLRTDIMLDGRKELERRTAFSSGGNSVAEYTMLYGAGGVLGRRHAGGASEWYVKDRQGSLVMSVLDGVAATALTYEPFGFQRQLRVSGDVPAEQYTGKEYDGRLGLYYYGARYFDPSFALWLTPDPARQYLNPYSFGGDPVNAIDYDGMWSWKKTLLWAGAEILSGGVLSFAAGLGFITGGTTSAVLSMGYEAFHNGDNFYKVNRWDWNKIGNSAAAGTLGGIPASAEMMTYASFANRYVESGFDWHIVTDFLTMGYFMELAGNTFGVTNGMLGGNMDWYEGNVVYSGAVSQATMPLGGCSYFGHAIFVDQRDNKPMIAHELTHARQMDRRGFRLGYMMSYLGEGSLTPLGDHYYSNPYEVEAYYFQYLYEMGYVDIYGNLKDGVSEDHVTWSNDFYNKSGDTNYDHFNAYRYRENVKNRYGDDWTWEEDYDLYTMFQFDLW